MDLKKEFNSVDAFHFILVTYISLDFSNMVCNFIPFAGVNSNGLSIKIVMYLTNKHDVEHLPVSQ